MASVGSAAAAPPQPNNLDIISKRRRSVQISWDHRGLATDTDHYAVYLHGEQTKTVGPGKWNTTLLQLQPGTTYEIGLTAVGSDGDESAMATVEAETPILCDPNTNFESVTDRGPNSITVEWKACDAASSHRDYWQVSLNDSKHEQVSSEKESTTITGLEPETEYEIEVAAVSTNGTHAEPYTYTATTKSAPTVPAPSNLTVNSTGLNVTLSWDAVDTSGIEIFQYNVRIDGALKEEVGADTTTSTFEVSSAGEHEFAVTAVSAGNVKSDTATVTATIEKPSATVALDLDQAQVGRGNSVSAPITLSEAPNGLSGYEITVSTGDSSVATIEDATYNDAFGLTEAPVFADDNSSVTLTGTDVDEKINSGDTDVTLASVTVAAEAAGKTSVDVTVEQIDADNGGKLAAATQGDELTVQELVSVGDRDELPTDPDGDGLYEDLNGNGRKDFDDVVTFFKNKDEDAITDYADAYDFNENGRIDFDDIRTLVSDF